MQKQTPRKTYAFVGDGETEQFAYVQELSAVHDKVFWMVDLDVIIRDTKAFKGPKDKTPAAVLKTKYRLLQTDPNLKKKVVFIANTPCLEYWILLHVVQTTKYYDSCDKVIPEIKKHTPLTEYSKTKKYYQQANDIYKRLKPYLTAAKTNAAKTL